MNPASIRHFLFTGNTNSSVTRNINEFKVFFGQFVSHDMSKTAGLIFNARPREQKNLQTSFLDLSNIYGTSEYGINYLRLKKKGMIKMVKCGDDILLSPDWNGITGCENSKYPCMLAGDLRLNQHPILTYLHVIWTLEHNRVAEKLYNLNPDWTDERLFQEASKLVRAEYQHIVYNELLPIIIGDKALSGSASPRLSTIYFTTE
ncbi:PXDN [Acanthosepion pharaonis]|uniref:PXDN n=1 Tax=Acanthosepion pharaonis TaxID=158019 RepID=A0A812EI53_ACAPH|nr:PXDN [Sepia pharaonis]